MGKSITPKTRVVFVANPNNPTGTFATAEEVRHLIQVTPPHVVLVMDEAYIEFLENPLDLVPLIRSGEKVKRHPDAHLLENLRPGRLAPRLRNCAPRFHCRPRKNPAAVQYQFPARRRLDWRRWTMWNTSAKRARIISPGRKFLQDAFTKMGLEYEPSFANFVLVKVGQGQRVFDEMHKLGVITRPMGGYQLPEWIRISVGTPPRTGAPPKPSSRSCGINLRRTSPLPSFGKLI